MKRNLYLVKVAIISIIIAACQKSSQLGTGTSQYAPKPANLRLNLTDAPHDELKNVFVNIDHAEILLSGGGKKARLILGQNMGLVDLMTLRNGVLLPIEDVAIPNGVSAHQIRLVLKPEGHYATKVDGSTCAMHTPSEQLSGIKILIHPTILFENNYSYSLVVDFDAQKSVVQQGNGGCLLKPVLKLKSATRIVDGGNEGTDDEDVVEPAPEDPTDPVDPVEPEPPAGTDGDDTVEWGYPILGGDLNNVF